MQRVCALLLLAMLLAGIGGGCISAPKQVPSSTFTGTPGSSHHSLSERSGGAASVAVTMRTAPINGTFSGNLTAPSSIFEDVARFLNGTNATLYAFEAMIIGEKLNASITVYVLKLVPPSVPERFNVTANAHPVNGTVIVPYASKVPVSVEFGQFEATSYLEVHPENVLKATGTLNESELNNLNGSTILTVNGFRFVVQVSSPGNYTFMVFHNGTEVSAGGLELRR